MTVAGRDDLIEEIRRLLIQSQVTEFVADQQRWFGVVFEFANERVIDL